MYEYILSSVDGPVGVVTLNRPKQLNALAGPVMEELVNALLSRGAPLDVRDQTFDGTPLEWAQHGGQGREEIIAALRRHQA